MSNKPAPKPPVRPRKRDPIGSTKRRLSGPTTGLGWLALIALLFPPVWIILGLSWGWLGFTRVRTARRNRRAERTARRQAARNSTS